MYLIDRVLQSRGTSLSELNKCTGLESPLHMKNMDRAVEIIKQSKSVMIVSDYDVDGIMSLIVMYKVLKSMGRNVSYIIPNRVTDGYGVSERIHDVIKNCKADTIITCDNGVGSIDMFTDIVQEGKNVLVTDHHIVPNYKDNGTVVIDVQQESDTYKFKKLCGAGVVYQLARALDYNDCESLLPFVAIATVCDSVELLNENRYIVKRGLELCNTTTNCGLMRLLYNLSLTDKDINTYDVGFKIGPRLNAAGRLKSADIAVKLFLSDTYADADEIIEELNRLNSERQEMTEIGDYSVRNIIGDRVPNNVLVMYLPELNPAVNGIVAGHMVDTYNLPSVVLSDTPNGYIAGSGRSPSCYSLYDILSKYKKYFRTFGGHREAAGLTIDFDNIRDFIMDIAKSEFEVKKVEFKGLDVSPSDIGLGDIRSLADLEPYGYGNSKPLFKSEEEISRVVIADKYVSLFTFDNRKLMIFRDIPNVREKLVDSIGTSSLARLCAGHGSVVMSFTYTCSENNFRGEVSPLYVIKDFEVIKKC